ncbi:MAG TPA: hypothetical protein VFW45_18525 [Candidatus Polarisedimenticolia bacterium]|nr:hypothetical protein [Candidatus Polarisedimenticolia bacterium]
MGLSIFSRFLTFLGAAALATPALGAAPAVSRLQEAGSKAAACLARDYDGRAFRDPYLRYVYPEEKLEGTASDPDLTYRRIDADIMLVLLAREGKIAAALRPAVDRASRALHELPPLWAGKGFNNLRKNPEPEGIALDTFCIVGWLEADRAMAQAAAQALDGDGWLPEGLYEGEESFRRDADEAWCLRLLASPAGIGLNDARRVLDRLLADLRDARKDPAGRRSFYAAYHLSLLLEETMDLGSGIDAGALREELAEAMAAWAAARPRGREPASDLLEWANLVTAKLPRLESTGLRRRGVEILLRQQGEDGCWHLPGARPPEAGSSFLTLRALLALSAYRDP